MATFARRINSNFRNITMRSLDHDGQQPVCFSPWQTGTELYEAYGRFLDRMRDGTMPEGDCGWCDGTKLAISGTSSNYDANLQYTEAEAEAYLEEQRIKHAKSQKIAEKAVQKYAEVKTFRQLRDAKITELCRRIINAVQLAGSMSFCQFPAKWRAYEELRNAWHRLIRAGVIVRTDRKEQRGKARFSLASKLSETSTS